MRVSSRTRLTALLPASRFPWQPCTLKEALFICIDSPLSRFRPSIHKYISLMPNTHTVDARRRCECPFDECILVSSVPKSHQFTQFGGEQKPTCQLRPLTSTSRIRILSQLASRFFHNRFQLHCTTWTRHNGEILVTLIHRACSTATGLTLG